MAEVGREAEAATRGGKQQGGRDWRLGAPLVESQESAIGCLPVGVRV